MPSTTLFSHTSRPSRDKPVSRDAPCKHNNYLKVWMPRTPMALKTSFVYMKKHLKVRDSFPYLKKIVRTLLRHALMKCTSCILRVWSHTWSRFTTSHQNVSKRVSQCSSTHTPRFRAVSTSSAVTNSAKLMPVRRSRLTCSKECYLICRELRFWLTQGSYKLRWLKWRQLRIRCPKSSLRATLRQSKQIIYTICSMMVKATKE